MYFGLHVKYRYPCQILNTLEFSQQILEKCPNTKCHENQSIMSQVFPVGMDRWTEGLKGGPDESNSRFSQFCQQAYKSCS